MNYTKFNALCLCSRIFMILLSYLVKLNQFEKRHLVSVFESDREAPSIE